MTDEGDLVSPSQSKVTSQGQSFIDKTKDRRTSPLIQSKYEDADQGFFPVYSPRQLHIKNNHTIQVLKKLGKNATQYAELSERAQLRVDSTIVEGLLAQPDSELYMNVMGQGREPIALVLNRGKGGYELPNHVATFERRPEVFDYNSYISNYIANDEQIENFDLTNSTVITYEDLLGNLHDNTGPIFGQTNSPTVSPTSENVTSDNSDSNPEL